jgi:hypothetical protein
LFGSAILSAGARTGTALDARRRVMIHETIVLNCGAEISVLHTDPNTVAMIKISDTRGRPTKQYILISDERIAFSVDPQDFKKLKYLIDMLVPPVNIIDRIQNFILGH